MATPLHQCRIRVPLIAAAAGMLAWQLIPGTAPDRMAFEWVTRSFANPPRFVSGFGSRQTPWSLLTFSSTAAADKRHAPMVVALGDDPHGVFQSSPPSPVDLAVILSNFQRLGAKKAACAAVLAWDAPDVMGLAALDRAILKFDSMVMAAPVSRGASPQSLPESFRRTSIPVTSVEGDLSMIPVVNRIPLPDVILGGMNTAAGFTSIDSEENSERPFLLARWGDRVVFAFPLVVVMQRLEVHVDSVRIVPGDFIRLGSKGPIIPIDESGRMSAPLGRIHPYITIPAEDLIDGGDELFPKMAPDPVILRDDRGSAEPSTRLFSNRLPGMIASISSSAGMSSAMDFPRMAVLPELIFILGVCAAVAAIVRLPRFAMRIGFALTTTAILAAQVLAAGVGSCWLPGCAALVGLAAGAMANAWINLRCGWGEQLPSSQAATISDEDTLSPNSNPPEPEPEPATKPEKKPRAPRRKVQEKAQAMAEKIAPKPRKPRVKKSDTPDPAPSTLTDKPAKPESKPGKSRSKKSGTTGQGLEDPPLPKKAATRSRRKPES